MSGAHRVSQRVSRAYSLGRAVRATQSTRLTLLRRVTLVRALTQTQHLALAGLPVQLQILSTVLTRSLALLQTLVMQRAVVQGQALELVRDVTLLRTVRQSSALRCSLAARHTLLTTQGASVSLSSRNVTPFYQLLVATTVGQQLALSSAGTGRTAREFIVSTRDAMFVVIPGRAGRFTAAPRGVRFTVEGR
jgi:hypothetical protein